MKKCISCKKFVGTFEEEHGISVCEKCDMKTLVTGRILWACLWKDTGEIVEELKGENTFFHIFRTRKEATKNKNRDTKVQKIEASFSAIR